MNKRTMTLLAIIAWAVPADATQRIKEFARVAYGYYKNSQAAHLVGLQELNDKLTPSEKHVAQAILKKFKIRPALLQKTNAPAALLQSPIQPRAVQIPVVQAPVVVQLAETQAPVVASRAVTPAVVAPTPVVDPAPVIPTEPATTKTQTPLKIKTREWGSDFDAVKKVFDEISTDRHDLKQLREKNIKMFKNRAGKEQPNFMEITQAVSADTIAYLQLRIEQTLDKLGTPPTPFCLFTMGSLARGEAGFITDLEIGILIKEKTPSHLKYFERFSQMLSDRFFLLGEHPDVGGKGMRIDEADVAPLHVKFYARYAATAQLQKLLSKALATRDFSKIPYEGSRVFIATPDEFARQVHPKFLQEMADRDKHAWKEIEEKLFNEEFERAKRDPKNKEVSDAELAESVGRYVRDMVKSYSPKERTTSSSTSYLTRNVKLLFGDQAIFDDYLSARYRYLEDKPEFMNPNYSTRRQEIVYLKMKDDTLKYITDANSSIASGRLGDEIDLKRELYRYFEQVLTDLGFWHNLEVQNTKAIAEQLIAKGVIGSQFGAEIIQALNYAVGLRLKEQEKYKKQGYHTVSTQFRIPVTVEKYDELYSDFEKQRTDVQRTYDFLLATHSPERELEKIATQLTKINAELKDLPKLKPGQPDSILSPDVIEALNTKHLPTAQKLFKAAQAFLSGNKDAFCDEPSQQQRGAC